MVNSLELDSNYLQMNSATRLFRTLTNFFSFINFDEGILITWINFLQYFTLKKGKLDKNNVKSSKTKVSKRSFKKLYFISFLKHFQLTSTTDRSNSFSKKCSSKSCTKRYSV